ncbi:MAG TPA: phage recombination protein Bet [Gemmatimonadaceae bacterium]|nr:phage recombination protein Bet [Gemmatimonadaceae bacterium]
MTQNQSTSLVKTPAAGAIAKWNATPEQVQLLKNTIAKGTTDDEFALFMTVAMQMELNPFLRQIHAVRRWDPEQERMVMQIQTGIDGYRLMAERSGVYGGQEGPWWCGEDGQWVDVWLAKAAPAAAKVVVHRTDKPRPFVAIALWTEYLQTKKDGTLTAMWRKRGPGQLAKCAEALAFRRAFPIEIGGGAHVDVEMDYIEAEAVEQPQFVAPPPPQGPPPGVPMSSAQVPATKSTNVVMHNATAVVRDTPNGPVAVTVTDTGTKPTEQKRGPGRPPKNPPAQPSQTPGTDPFRAAREAVDAREAARLADAMASEAKIAARPTTPAAGDSRESSPAATAPQQTGSSSSSASSSANSPASSSSASDRDRWGQPIGDPTAGAAPSTAAPTPTSSSAATNSPDAGPSPESSSTADDGFGGEDPADSEPVPTGDPGLQLVADLQKFLGECKSQKDMYAGFGAYKRRSAELCEQGDPRFAVPSAGKPGGELAMRMTTLWAERKAQLPV